VVLARKRLAPPLPLSLVPEGILPAKCLGQLVKSPLHGCHACIYGT